jgi:PPOX class probable F420-dependent enzyme
MAPTNPFPNLSGHQFMSLTTFRKSGQPVPTPVWFAQVEDKLVVMTQANAGKVKRIRHTARVTVAPCDQRGGVLGEAVAGQARVLDAAEGQTANGHLNRKYGWMKRMFDLFQWLNRTQRVYLEIRA